jgi:copper resistance protein B
MNDRRRSAWVRLAAVVISVSTSMVASRAASGQQMPAAAEMMDWGKESFIIFDELDYVPGLPGRPISFEGLGWYGGAYNRLWFRTEGEQTTQGSRGAGEIQLLAGRLISPYWDAVAGVRVDRRWEERNDGRTSFALGIIGESPLRFEFAPTLFVSTDGNISARLDASYQFLFTQKMILEPSLDLNAAARAVPELGVGSGLNEVVLAGRLRYEIRRKFGPYVGIAWTRRTGSTVELDRSQGRNPNGANLLFGLRVWR